MTKCNLSETDRYPDDALHSVSQHNVYAQIPFYVIMSNHIHLILAISNDDCDDCTDVACYVSTGTEIMEITKIKKQNTAISQRSPKCGILYLWCAVSNRQHPIMLGKTAMMFEATLGVDAEPLICLHSTIKKIFISGANHTNNMFLKIK